PPERLRRVDGSSEDPQPGADQSFAVRGGWGVSKEYVSAFLGQTRRGEVTNSARVAVDFADESEESDVVAPPSGSRALVSGVDWTTETIVGQLRKDNIKLNPKFQRRDAWKRD